MLMIIWFNLDIGKKTMEQTQDSTSNFEFSIIEPSNIEELVKALEVQSMLELLVKDGNAKYETLLNSERANITRYIDSIGKFNNVQMIVNLNFLLKKYGLRIGELEQVIGVSPGYISRTAKENSQKKLSIDVVWKLAKLFGLSLEEMVESRINIPHDNTGILTAFIKKLLLLTKTNKIEWCIQGGRVCEVDEDLNKLGIIHQKNNIGVYAYQMEHLNPELTWVIASDIVAIKKFDNNRSLVVIPYVALSEKNKDSDTFIADGYDFIFVWNENNQPQWEKFFYTSEDAFGGLKELTTKLIESIQTNLYEAKISLRARCVIENFLND